MMNPHDDLAEHIMTTVEIASMVVNLEPSDDITVERALMIAESLRNATPLDTKKACERAEERGFIARLVLTTVLRAAESGYPEFASVNAVLRSVSLHLQRAGVTGASLESLELRWRKCRDVAHMWAAIDDSTGLDLSQAALAQFLARAEDLRRRGEEHKPPNRRESILDAGKTRKVPPGVPLPTVTAALPPLSDDELRFLKNSTG